jgi:ferredoxin
MKVGVDLAACQGYIACVLAAPEVFDIDDTVGTVVILQPRPGADLIVDTETAVRACPAQALFLIDD